MEVIAAEAAASRAAATASDDGRKNDAGMGKGTAIHHARRTEKEECPYLMTGGQKRKIRVDGSTGEQKNGGKMMKKMMTALVLLMIAMLLITAAGAESVKTREIILMTEYQQMGWGETFQLGAVDSDGRLWFCESDTRGDVPYGNEELLAWAETTDQLEPGRQIAKDDLADLVSLVQTVPVQTLSYQSGACDAGEQTSYAIRRDRQGNAEIVVLGASGDDTCENTDPGAQSLYRSLRGLFPGVTAFDGEEGMSPAGFQKTDLLTFCGCEGIDLTRLSMKAFANDCEEGPSEIEPPMNAEEIVKMAVTGKRNSLSTTGNTVFYCFEDGNGENIAVFEFYGELLVRPDGMYTVGK